VAQLRTDYPVLHDDQTPIDVFTFLEVDLGLDPIPFDDLCAKYRVEAAIKADFTGIYLDAEQYKLMEKGPGWKLSRLRFTVAHELAHFFLHKDIPQASSFASDRLLPDGMRTTAGANIPSNRKPMNSLDASSCRKTSFALGSMNSPHKWRLSPLILWPAASSETLSPQRSPHASASTLK
jgi:hypothetical protein